MLVFNIALLTGRGQEEQYRTCLLHIPYTAVRNSWYCIYVTVRLMLFGEIIAIGEFIRHASVHTVGRCRVVSCYSRQSKQ